MKEKKPTIIEAYVDPFDPPMPPKVEPEFVKNIAESFARGQPYASRIGLTIYRNQIHEILKSLHHHDLLEKHNHKNTTIKNNND
jgi:pyruvate dehydrogenase (quinone)/pyruvate oxidase